MKGEEIGILIVITVALVMVVTAPIYVNQRVTLDQINYAATLCETNQGIDYISADLHDMRAVCQNQAVFEVKKEDVKGETDE